MNVLRIIYQDEELVAVEKPAGFHVHSPEDPSIRISSGENALKIVRDQLGKYLYPVHRIDRGTSGVLLYALTPASAASLSAQFRAREIQKIYAVACRGWPEKEEWTINSPMENSLDIPGPLMDAETKVQVTARFRLDQPIGKYPETRYSLLWAMPTTGRTHQIRRHLRRAGHPVLGDSIHGDGDYNRWIREMHQGRNFLYLKAYSLKFRHPTTGESLELRANWREPWQKLFKLAGLCPWRAPTLTSVQSFKS